MVLGPLLFVVILGRVHATFNLNQPIRNCTQPGPFCESCTSVVICIENSDDSWTKNAIGTCSVGEKCINGTCTTAPEPICDGTADLDFICKKVGIFPDPFFCNKFVLCVDLGLGNLAEYLNECSDGYGYDAGTSACDVKLDGGQCQEGDYPVPLCNYIGQSGALEANPSIFYTCEEYSQVKEVLYPVLDRCPHGEVYENYSCKEPESTTASGSGSTEQTRGTTTN